MSQLLNSDNALKSWADSNRDSRFRDVPVDIKKVTYDVESKKYTHKYANICKLFDIDAKQRPEDGDITRRRRMKPRARVSRLCMPIQGEYSTYGDYRTGNFFVHLFNLCKAHGLFEPKLLVNHAFMHNWSPAIYANDDYLSQFEIPESYCLRWHNFIRKNILEADIDDVKFYAYKETSIGPPFAYANGTFFSINDILYGQAEDMETVMQVALKKDFSVVKKSFFPLFSAIHDEQVYVSQIGLDNYKGSIIDLYLRSILPTAVEGFRMNSIDKVINIKDTEDATLNNEYYTKDRAFNLFLPGSILFGKIDSRKFSKLCADLCGYKYSFGAVRRRGILNMAWPSQASSLVSSKMVMAKLEDSSNGFANTSDVSIDGYREFLRHCYSRGSGKFLFLNGDRSNAETFVTTNYDKFRLLIPPELRKLYDFQDSAFVLGDGTRPTYFIEGLPSGSGRTTELNWFAGTYEAIYTLSEILKEPIHTVLDAYLTSVENEQPFFNIGEFTIKLFMPTDDIPLVIYGPTERLDLTCTQDSISSQRKMEWNVNSEAMTTFGMNITKDGLSAAQVSVISKLFYSEHPGFFVKDCFSTHSKLVMLPHDLRRDIDRLLTKFYGIDEVFYQAAGNAFLGWLKDLGIPLSAVVDQYSPMGKIVYGNLVDKDALYDSTRVDTSYIQDIFNWYKKTVRDHFSQDSNTK